MTPAIRRFADRILDTSRKLPQKTLAAKLRRMKVTLAFQDTETSGLKDWKDVIHEFAMIAVSKHFDEIGKTHLKLILEQRRPERLLEKGIDELHKVIPLATARYMNTLVKKIRLRCKYLKDFSQPTSKLKTKKKVETAYYEVIHNFMERLMTDHGIDRSNAYLVRTLYWGLYWIVEAIKIEWVLKLTYFDDGDAQRIDDERKLAKSYNTFIEKTERETKTNAVLVGQNFEFDQKMIYAAARRAKEKYRYMRFIDTVLVTKKFVSRYMLVAFIYLYEKWLRNRKNVVLRNVLLKLHPLPKNKQGIVTDYFKVSNPMAHSAINDVRVLVDLFKVQLAVDLRFHEASQRNEELAKINRRVGKEFGFTKKGTPYDFLHGPNDPFRKEHRRLYEEFLELIGAKKEDYLPVIRDYDRKKDDLFFKKIAETYPCLKLNEEYNPKRFKVAKTWKKKSVF